LQQFLVAGSQYLVGWSGCCKNGRFCDSFLGESSIEPIRRLIFQGWMR